MFTMRLSLSPKAANLHALLGAIEASQDNGQSQDAEGELRRSIQLDPH